MKTIYLHGYLADLYADPIPVQAATVAEAMQALSMIPELQDGPYRVRIEGVDTDIALYSETSLSEIHVHPLTGGAGGGRGLAQILIGVAVIAVAVMFPPSAALIAMGVTQGSLFLAGGMMIVGGLLEMLMPVPSVDQGEAGESSKFLGSAMNSVKIGTPVTLAYGTNKLGGQYLSFDIDAFDYTGEADLELPSGGKGAGPQGLVSQNGHLFEYDKVVGMPLAVVCPIYTSATPSPDNVPTPGWTP